MTLHFRRFVHILI